MIRENEGEATTVSKHYSNNLLPTPSLRTIILSLAIKMLSILRKARLKDKEMRILML